MISTIIQMLVEYILQRFVTECVDKEPKIYKATYIMDGEECIHYLCARHAQMDCFKEGLIKLEPIMTA